MSSTIASACNCQFMHTDYYWVSAFIMHFDTWKYLARKEWGRERERSKHVVQRSLGHKHFNINRSLLCVDETKIYYHGGFTWLNKILGREKGSRELLAEETEEEWMLPGRPDHHKCTAWSRYPYNSTGTQVSVLVHAHLICVCVCVSVSVSVTAVIALP